MKKFPVFYGGLCFMLFVEACRWPVYLENKSKAPSNVSQLVSDVCAARITQFKHKENAFLALGTTDYYLRNTADALFRYQLSPFFEGVLRGDTLYLLEGGEGNHYDFFVKAFNRQTLKVYDGAAYTDSLNSYRLFEESKQPLFITDSFFVAQVRKYPAIYDHMVTGNSVADHPYDQVFSMIFINKGNLVVRSVFSEYRPYYEKWEPLVDKDGEVHEWKHH